MLEATTGMPEYVRFEFLNVNLRDYGIGDYGNGSIFLHGSNVARERDEKRLAYECLT